MITQKAKGIFNGTSEFFQKHYKVYNDRGHQCYLSKLDHRIITSDLDFGILSEYDFPFFARPCPKTPRHGFIESRKVSDLNELKALWNEVRKEDPQGEIVLGKSFHEVEYNSVLVSSGQLSIGAGNDGATGGKDSISFPVVPYKFNQTFKKASGIRKNDAIYVEAIKASSFLDLNSRWYLTQFRGGPKIETSAPDYIPEKIKVAKIITPSHDLLEWEKTCKNMKRGTVVWGSGYTLASHAGVHCILNKIPFITTKKPKVGEVLQPVVIKEPKLEKEMFSRGVSAGKNSIAKLDNGQSFYFALSVLHNWAYLRQSEHASWLLGAASIMYAQLCMSLIFGEHRHCRQCRGKESREENRTQVYDNVHLFPNKYAGRLPSIVKCYNLNKWSSGYGGLPWATCAWHTYKLWQSLTKVHTSRNKFLSDSQISELVGAMNMTTNLAHNGGWWFNKIVDKEDLDLIAAKPSLAALGVSDIYFKLHNDVKKSKIQKLSRVKNLKEPFSRNKDGTAVWCIGALKKKTEDDAYDFNLNHKNSLKIKLFQEGKELKSKTLKFKQPEFDKLVKAVKKKNLPATKNFNLSVVNGKVVLPTGKKVAV